MTRHFTPPHPVAPRAMAVGHLGDLDAASRLAVVALRLWYDRGAAGVAHVLGPDGDARAAQVFGALCACCVAAARRPLMRHGAGCPCLGADEAVFAAFLQVAAEGERGDALMMAFALLRPEAAAEGVARAQQAGLMLRRIVLRTGASCPLGGRLH